MKYPMSTTYENIDYYLLINQKYSFYQNFYFGTNETTIADANNFSIYKGTFQNLDSLTGATVSSPEKSV